MRICTFKRNLTPQRMISLLCSSPGLSSFLTSSFGFTAQSFTFGSLWLVSLLAVFIAKALENHCMLPVLQQTADKVSD